MGWHIQRNYSSLRNEEAPSLQIQGALCSGEAHAVLTPRRSSVQLRAARQGILSHPDTKRKSPKWGKQQASPRLFDANRAISTKF